MLEKKRKIKYTYDMARFKQDDIVELEIVGYGANGEGVARIDEYVFFIPQAIKSEKIQAKVIFVKGKTLVFCKLKQVLTSSENRIKPICNRFERCGGCDLIHLSYAEQLNIKKENIISLLKKNAGIEFKVDDVVPSNSVLGYRNKIQLPFGTVNGHIAMGFFQEKSHKIVSITKCFLHGEWVEKLISVFLNFATTYNLTAYDDIKKSGLLRHMVARYIDGQYCIVVVTNKEHLPKTKQLMEMLNEAIGDKYALYNSVKKTHDNVILGEIMLPIKHMEIVVDILGINLKLNPYSFLQLNNEIRDKIYKRIIDEINAKVGKKIVIDAYAGVGALGAILAKSGATVYNIEIVKEATLDGIALAKENGLEGKVYNINGDASICLPELISKLKKDKNDDSSKDEELSVILDPPRKGCEKRVLDALVRINKSFNIFYISCNPATLTRDIAILLQDGFTIAYVTPYDMFPQTKHIETLVCLVKKS